MIIKDEIKMEVIEFVDNLNSHYDGFLKQYTKELKRIKEKYMYKDIEYHECKKDVDTINQIKKDLKFWKEFLES